MTHIGYIVILCVALVCLGVIDHRFRLALFYDRLRTSKVLFVSVLLFLVWDVAGIQLGIFFIGDTEYLTGLRLLPNLPIEEVLFLTLLNYSALLAWRGGEQLWPRT